MNAGEIIPIAYDYGCAYGDCNNRFGSFNSDTSPDATLALSEFLPGGWIRKYKSSNSNLVGINKKSKLVFARLRRGLRVKGVICSNNYDP